PATFDSSATPKPGQQAKAPSSLAEVDLDAIRAKLAKTIELARADDPRELRRRIAELERQLKAAPTAIKVETQVERIEVPVLKGELLGRIEKVVQQLDAVSSRIYAPVDEIKNAIAKLGRAPAGKNGESVARSVARPPV